MLKALCPPEFGELRSAHVKYARAMGGMAARTSQAKSWHWNRVAVQDLFSLRPELPLPSILSPLFTNKLDQKNKAVLKLMTGLTARRSN